MFKSAVMTLRRETRVLHVFFMFLLLLQSSSDDFSVVTPDETNGQEFSLGLNLRN